MIRKFFSIFLVFAAIVIALLLIFFLSINLFFPKKKFENTAANLARTYLNKDLELKGISFGVISGLKIKNLRLSKSISFSSGDLIDVRGLSVKLDLPQLIKNKSIVINALVDSFSVDLFKSKHISKQKSAKTAGEKSGIPNAVYLKHTFLQVSPYRLPTPWTSFISLTLNNGEMHYLYNNVLTSLKLNGIINIFPDKKDNKIDFNDFVLTKGKDNLHVKGNIDNFIEPGNIAFSFSLTGNRRLFQEVTKIFYTNSMSDVDIQIGEGEKVDLTVKGDSKNIRIVTKTKK
jgi:uncharacterized Zn ribbon protein